MPEFLEDPSVLTKEQLKNELLAHSVPLPTGNPPKDVFVRLYLKSLTALNGQRVPDSVDVFSSDEELPPVVVTGRTRSSGRKSIRKAEPLLEQLDVTMLTDESLRAELMKLGVDIGPVVASTRKLYEKKLQKLLVNGPPEVGLQDVQISVNGSADTELYSDQEDEPGPKPVVQSEPEPEPEVVLVQRAVRSRGKTPVSTHQTVEKIAASEPTLREEQRDVIKEFINDPITPTGLSATCRRPIRGAAGRPVPPTELWDDVLIPPKTSRTSSSSQSESLTMHRVSSPPLYATPPVAPHPVAQHGRPRWLKLLLLVLLLGFLFLVYQNMESNSIGPFQSETPPSL
ncbi:lamina-associated polypeptide 2 [Gouania willdenowi]|uniref:Thymopoietin a n=1 Tax=Gouania willdenowi TaxID=441366 RepID=A0A8C5GC42_GOUWI|nr:thymopoietin [Gouania willdenowi]